jgi:hypothetical protein
MQSRLNFKKLLIGLGGTLLVVSAYLVLSQDRIPGYSFRGGNPLNSRAEKILVGFKGEQPFVWMMVYRRGFFKGIHGRVDIINPVEEKRVRSLADDELGVSGWSVRDVMWQHDFFVVPNNADGVQCRAADGELVETTETLSKKFPELRAGIGKVNLERDGAWRLTTKDGLTYRYFPNHAALLTEAQLDQRINAIYSTSVPLDTTQRDVERRVAWGLSAIENTLRFKLYATQKIHSTLSPPYGAALLTNLEKNAQPNPKTNEMEEMRREKLLVVLPEIFLDAKILASSNRYAVVRHRQTIEKNAATLLSCVTLDGKIIWQLTNPPLKPLEKNDGSETGMIHHNTIVILTNGYDNKSACGLDIETGNVLWAFSAF